MASVALNLPPDISPEEARLLLAIKLYETHRISLGKAAEMAGFSKPAFMEILPRYGVPVFDYPPGDLEAELAL